MINDVKASGLKSLRCRAEAFIGTGTMADNVLAAGIETDLAVGNAGYLFSKSEEIISFVLATNNLSNDKYLRSHNVFV